MDTRGAVVHVSCVFIFLSLHTYSKRKLFIYLCIAMVPISMAAKIFYCKNKKEIEKEREKKNERRGRKRVKVG